VRGIDGDHHGFLLDLTEEHGRKQRKGKEQKTIS
jgi:hypothetical protein